MSPLAEILRDPEYQALSQSDQAEVRMRHARTLVKMRAGTPIIPQGYSAVTEVADASTQPSEVQTPVSEVVPPVVEAGKVETPAVLTAPEIVARIERQQNPEFFDKPAIEKQVEKSGAIYVKAAVSPNSLTTRPGVETGVSVPDKGAIVVDETGAVIDGNHRAVDAMAAGEATIEAYLPVNKNTPQVILENHPDLAAGLTKFKTRQNVSDALDFLIQLEDESAELSNERFQGVEAANRTDFADQVKDNKRNIAAVKKALTPASVSIVEFFDPATNRGAVIVPSMKMPGGYQVSFFDERGVNSDMQTRDISDAIREARRVGKQRSDGNLERLVAIREVGNGIASLGGVVNE